MEKEELQAYIKKYNDPTDVETLEELIGIYQKCLFKIISDQVLTNNDRAKSDARIVLQMIFTKLTSLKKLLSGIQFDSEDGIKMNNIIDPTVIAGLIRTIFEQVGMFNNVYTLTVGNPDEALILYNLWVIAGLNNRQKFVDANSNGENQQKSKEEREEIIRLTNEIEGTNKFKGLSTPNRDRIYKRIQDLDYRLRFDGNDVRMLNGYQDTIEKSGVKPTIFNSIYKYLSQYSHPSNVAVFQYANMFSAQNPSFFEMTGFNVRMGVMLSSVFIADYIKLFPDALPIFERLPLSHQVVINFQNKFMRGEEYSINDCLSKLN